MRERVGRDERGSVVLVVILMSVASVLVLIMINSVSSGMSRASDDQRRSNAFQFANAGIDQALHRIEKKPLPSSDVASSGFHYKPLLTADGKVSAFSETFTSGGIDYSIRAEQTPQGQDTVWRVNSTGRDRSGKLRQAVATIRATSLFENGLFTTNSFYITGNQFNETTPVAYNSALCPTALPASVVACNLPNPVGARLGSNTGFPVNSPIAIKAMVDQWAGFALYGHAKLEDAQALCGTNTKCHTVESSNSPLRKGSVIAVPEALAITMPEISGACPNGGRLGSGMKPPVPTLAPGDYRCSRLTIQGTLDVGGGATGVARIRVDSQVSIVPGKPGNPTRVNWQQRPRRFQLFLPEQPKGSADVSQICGSEIWGLLYTPGLDIDCQGTSQTTIYGAVVARSYSGTGNHFAFHWDATAENGIDDGKYRVYNWRECPVGTVDC
jgi:hypothetical protein